MKTKSMKEYRRLNKERNAVISRNRSNLVKNRKLKREGKDLLPISDVPDKPEPPKVFVAYDKDGNYQGRLMDEDDLDFAKEQGFTIKMEDASY